MVKQQTKALQTKKNLSNTLLEYNSQSTKKSVQQLNKEHYQKNKAKIKERQQERYQQQKELAEKQEKEQSAKYYGAEAIKVLMSLKEYTELNQAKRKIWLNFVWILKQLTEGDINISNIVEVMKLREEADKLIRDYDKTAKAEVEKGKHSWDTLEQEQKDRLIKYWGYEKARIENNYLDEAERLERQSQEYLKEIELAKFHEERGKIKCECYRCSESKRIQSEIKEQLFKEETEEKALMIEGECNNCYEYKKVSSESGLCRKCSKEQKE